MDLLEEFIEETSLPDQPWPVQAHDYVIGAKILDEQPFEKLVVAHAALQRLEEALPPLNDGKAWNVWHYSPRRYRAGALKLILQALFQTRLPMSSKYVDFVLKAITCLYRPDSSNADYYFFWLPLPTIVRNLEWYFEEMTPSLQQRDLIQQLIPMLEKNSKNHQKNSKLADRLSKLPGVVCDSRPEPGDAWADRARSDLEKMSLEKRSIWEVLFAHAGMADGARPTGKWLAEAERYRQAIGEEDSTRYISEWLKLVVPPPLFTVEAPSYPEWSGETGDGYKQYQRQLEQYKDEHKTEIEAYTEAHHRYFAAISEKNLAILKGLTWYVFDCNKTDVALGLGHLVSAAFSSVRERGAWATKVGNAGIWALGQMPGGVGVGPLARLRTRLRDRGALKLIAAAIESAAKAAGMPVDELEDLAVPTGGLEADGTRRETFGAEGAANLTLDAATGQTHLEWFGADGKPRKAVPAGVKREFAAEVKALKAAEEEVKQALSTQATRFDGFLLGERVWPL